MAADTKLRELLLRAEEMHDEGRSVSAEDLGKDHPELIPELKRRIEEMRGANPLQLAATVRQAAPSPTPAVNDSSLPTIKGGPGAPPQPQDSGRRFVIPGYQIEKELGRGGMGVVFKALELKHNRVVALKTIHPERQASELELKRFQVEAEAVLKLQHPNIVKIYDFDAVDGHPYFSLEYLEGGALDDKLDGKPMAPREAALLLATLARAMYYAHQNNIVHRDLKPSNVLLADDGTPKIADFGLAKNLEGGANLTSTGNVMGTPCYMAPEQAAGQTKKIAPATDIYALGAVMYELLTGRPPFDAETPLEIIRQVINDEPRSLRRLCPALPAALDTICLKCLEKAPEARYASALDLAEDLDRFLADIPIRAQPVGPLVRGARCLKRNPVNALAALCLVCLASLVLLAALWWKSAR